MVVANIEHTIPGIVPDVLNPALVDGHGKLKTRFARSLAELIRESTDSGAILVNVLVAIAVDNVYREMDGEWYRIPCKISDRIAAIDRLLERGFGKVVQEIELVSQSDDSEMERRLEEMTTEELEAHLSRLESNVIEPDQSQIVA
jgi:hypothetical protein